MKYRIGMCVGIMLMAMVGCRSVLSLGPNYSTLPAEGLRAAAVEIEQVVQKADRNAKLTAQPGIVTDTEAIHQAIRTRAARAELVNKLLDSGFAWERADGQLWLTHNSEYRKTTKSRQRDVNALLVQEENANRWAIYEGIVKASRLAPRSLNAVQSAFREARVSCLREGQQYEDKAGKMVRKGAEAGVSGK